jgi:spermidine/putrescine-binding protein
MKAIAILGSILLITVAHASLTTPHFEFDCERVTTTGKEKTSLKLGAEGGRLAAELGQGKETKKALADLQYKVEANSGLNFRYEISSTQDILMEEAMNRSGGRSLHGGTTQGGHMAIRQNVDGNTTYKIYLCTLK